MNIKGVLDVFIVTNGRSTFEFAHKSLENQIDVNFNLQVISGMKWVDANNHILDTCKSTYFLRVDDDMILHPLAVSYVYHVLANHKKRKPIDFAMFGWELWDVLFKKPWYGIKAYHWATARKVGFRLDPDLEKKAYGMVRGKIDLIFNHDICKKFKLYRKWSHKKKLQSIIGVVGFAGLDEQLDYRQKRLSSEQSGLGEYDYMVGQAKKFDMSLEKQYKLSLGDFVPQKDKHRASSFHDYWKCHDFS